MTPAPLTTQLPAEQSADELIAGLAALLPVRRSARPPRRYTYLDTPDGRLHRRGASLLSEAVDGGVSAVLTDAGESARCEARLATTPSFVWELPPGPLRDALLPVVDARRLLPLVEVESLEVELAVLGDEAKTVARLCLQSGRARLPEDAEGWRALPALLRVLPVRGYDAEFERAVRVVESRPGLAPTDTGPEGVALEAVGLPPSAWAARPRPPLRPDMRADEGLRLVHRTQLDVLLDNEGGVRADTDSEFLHDYRVAIRRTRAVLGQIKGVFPEVAVEHYRAEFKWLGSATGPVRDLDVLLLLLRMPDADAPAEGLLPLADFLEQEQRAAHARLKAALDDPRHERLLAGWRRFLEQPAPPTPDAVDAGRPLGAVVAERMARCHRRMLDDGRAIHDSSPPRALHALRIEAKRLRYLLDAVRPLHGDEALRPLAVLKRLQDVLGGLQDTTVQAELLTAAGMRMVDQGRADAETLMSLGRLLERTARRGAKLRRRFAKRWRAFDDSDARDRFEALFARHAEPGP
jgi:CHAD domain-containing protein